MADNNTGIIDFSGKKLTEKDVKECTLELRGMVLDDSRLKNFRTADEYLLRFLHTASFEIPVAFKKMQTFSDFILVNPNWFATMPPLDKKKDFDVNDKGVLRERDKSGRAILIVKVGRMDAVNTNPAIQSQNFDFWLEFMMDDPKIQAAGVSAILDMKNFSLGIFKWLTPTNIRLIVKKIDNFPFKELLIHVVNTNFLLNAAIKIIWPFLNDKLKNMFKFHFEDWPALHEYISPDVLPPEYGGTGSDIDHEKLNQMLFDRNEEIGAKLRYHHVQKET